MAKRAILTGVVVSFDDAAGLGVVRGEDGSELPFHCTAIADGTRSIQEQARVHYSVVPGRAGRFEANDLHPASG